MAKKIKLEHMYDDFELYALLIQRNFQEFAAESHLTAMALSWYYGNYVLPLGSVKAPKKKPLSVLELFAGNGTRHWPLISRNLPFTATRFEQLDLLRHPQSEANGVTVGNVLTHRFKEPFDIIYSPWDNMGVLLPEKGEYPTFAGLVDALTTCNANLKTGGCLSLYATCTPEELLGEYASEGGGTNHISIEVPLFDPLRHKFKLSLTDPLTLVSGYYMEFDRHSRVFSEYYLDPRIVTASGAVPVSWSVKGKNQIRCWSENELVDAIYLAGFSNTHFLHSHDDATLVDLADVDGLTLERAQILLAMK